MSKRIKAVIGAVALIIATVTAACDVDHSRGGYYPQPNPVFIPSWGTGPTYHSTTTVRVTQKPAAPAYKPAPAPKVSSPSRSK